MIFLRVQLLYDLLISLANLIEISELLNLEAVGAGFLLDLHTR